MFNLYNNTVVYIYCPAGTTTGGPEALHQLCDAINRQGGVARMVYIDYGAEKIVKASTPIPYRIYCTRSVTEVVDSERNIIIVPEIWPHLFAHYNKIQKAVWWLSVNYKRSDDIFSDKQIKHLYQSVYAKHFLLSNGIEQPLPLYDYLNIPHNKQNNRKASQVCYNPKKGFEVTNRIIQRLPNVSFIALQGLSKKEMAGVLSDSKIYIDFGTHPGKDRIPREAAIMGAVVITGTNGSAAFFEDLPILSKYKFGEDQIDLICEAIQTALANHKGCAQDFEYYRRVIKSQKKEFFIQAATLMVGNNFSLYSKISWRLYRFLPLNFIMVLAEFTINRLNHSLSADAKKNLKKLLYFKK